MTEHNSLIAALAAFHKEAVKVVKDAKAKVTGEKRDGSPVSYTYGYADLATVAEAVNPLLGKHGLAFISKPTMTPQGFGLVYKLAHEGGEAEEGFWPLPDPTRVKPQEMGSWITYWRRYALLATTNTFPSGEDDDGHAAGSGNQGISQADFDNLPKSRPNRTEQAFDQHARGVNSTDEPKAPKTSWTDDEVAGYVRKLGTVSVANAIQAYDWMAHRDLHNREVVIDGAAGSASVALAVAIGTEAIRPSNTVNDVGALREAAADRGLLKFQVSETESLEEVLHEAHELAAHAAVEQPEADTPDPQS